MVREVMASQLEPIAFEIHVPTFALLLRFASVPAAVEAQVHAAQLLLGAAKLVEGDAERALWTEHNERIWAGAGAVIRASWLPASLAAAIGELKICAAATGVRGAELLGRAGLGTGLIRIETAMRKRKRAPSTSSGRRPRSATSCCSKGRRNSKPWWMSGAVTATASRCSNR